MRTRKSRPRGRARSRAMKVVPATPPTQPAYPRGNPLTDSVSMTDAAGTSWLVYVEPAPSPAPLRRSAAVLPGRRLRFDSLDSSFGFSPIPAGAPYLPEARLRELLAYSQPVPAAAAPARGKRTRALWSVDWAGSLAGAAAAVRDVAVERWRATAEVRRLCVRGLVHLIAPAVLLLVILWEAVLVRPRARI